MNKLNWFDWLVLILVIIGGLNWGLVGFFKYDIIASIFGNMSVIARIIYDLVGLSALYLVFSSSSFAKK